MALDKVTTGVIADDAITSDQLGVGAIAGSDIAADVMEIKPHIKPGTLQPAIAGKLLDGTTAHSGDYGTAQSDGHKYYYTDIKGSKSIKDPRIGAHFGSQRFPVRSMQEKQEYYGNGVNKVCTIDGREWMRFMGAIGTKFSWDSAGHQLFLSSTSDTIEITGYFSEINMRLFSGSSYDAYTMYIDGGSGTAKTHPATTANPLGSRFTDIGNVVTIGTGTSLGIHTFKMVRGAESMYIYGFELIAQDTGSTARKSQIVVPAQNVVSYGKKFSIGSDTLTNAVHKHYNPFAFKTDGTTAWASGADNGTSLPVGTGSSHNIDTATSLGLENWKHSGNYYKPYNGGRVVRWIASDGTIKTSVTVMPPNAKSLVDSSTLTHANAKANASIANNTFYPTFEAHTTSVDEDGLAEVAKMFHWREFGNGSANGGSSASYADFTMLENSEDDVRWIWEDGLTGMVGNDNGTTSGIDWYCGGGDSMYIIWIGTGLSLKRDKLTGYAGILDTTYVQNLPYGTHIIHYKRASPYEVYIDGIELASAATGSNDYLGGKDIIFHQPKKPPVPEDACIIADYMLMADFKPQTTPGATLISKGVRTVSVSRDFFIDESDGDSLNFNVVGDPAGNSSYSMNLSGNADSDTSLKYRLPAFGTNWVHRGYKSDERVKLFLDSTDKDSDATKDNSDSDGSYSHLTSDLELGLYQFGANAANTKNGHTVGFDIVTPIHTSSHYQMFETPFIKELVGGDRNIEQHNLIVTPDGKTWDELRDTSYIGNSLVSTNWASQNNTNTTVGVGDEFRGLFDNKYLFYKDFALAHDKFICLVDGHYQIIFGNHMNADSGAHYSRIRINGAIVRQVYFEASGNGFVTGQLSVHLKRGEYVDHQGMHFTNETWQFQINRLK